ncbi:hypothetical protein BDP27DRAFT_1245295 [Rhodocollybia butyracea]|uniref:Ubiquitin-like protease family profile domain-containing protein n=1 Tax=Rhodocollybia butyracea TaxID=206335 RepID=A0A9P5TWH3_9AGAR|nr:hypothetical protein BDP27DRAFT_1245295 [Rhodocollybia butyracea]
MRLTKSDLDRISTRWLNDNLVEFLLKLWHYELSCDKLQLANQIHIFNPFLYQKLSTEYQNTPRWDRKVDIFKMKFLIVPINEW